MYDRTAPEGLLCRRPTTRPAALIRSAARPRREYRPRASDSGDLLGRREMQLRGVVGVFAFARLDPLDQEIHVGDFVRLLPHHGLDQVRVPALGFTAVDRARNGWRRCHRLLE